MTTTKTSLAETVQRCYETQDWNGLAALYAPDVLLDMQPPGWRYQMQGSDAVSAQWKAIIDQFEDFRVTWVRATPTQGGVVIEWEMHTGHGDNEHLCREADVLHGDGTKITEHVVFCTGMWDAATIARQKAEAPMVRW
ncbi:MAG: nuclear transport factor 2 family protein [Acidimicrobiales bacterium]